MGAVDTGFSIPAIEKLIDVPPSTFPELNPFDTVIVLLDTDQVIALKNPLILFHEEDADEVFGIDI